MVISYASLFTFIMFHIDLISFLYMHDPRCIFKLRLVCQMFNKKIMGDYPISQYIIYINNYLDVLVKKLEKSEKQIPNSFSISQVAKKLDMPPSHLILVRCSEKMAKFMWDISRDSRILCSAIKYGYTNLAVSIIKTRKFADSTLSGYVDAGFCSYLGDKRNTKTLNHVMSVWNAIANISSYLLSNVAFAIINNLPNRLSADELTLFKYFFKYLQNLGLTYGQQKIFFSQSAMCYYIYGSFELMDKITKFYIDVGVNLVCNDDFVLPKFLSFIKYWNFDIQHKNVAKINTKYNTRILIPHITECTVINSEYYYDAHASPRTMFTNIKYSKFMEIINYSKKKNVRTFIELQLFLNKVIAECKKIKLFFGIN